MVVEVALRKAKTGAANKLRSVLLALTLAASLVGCKTSLGSGAPGDAGPADGGSIAGETPCNPLAAKPIGLGAVVGVGTDSAGTLYVDAANGIFVSANGALVRQHVIGTGQSGSNEFIFTFESVGDDASSSRDLLVETQGSTATAMALGPGGARSFLGQSDAGVTPLPLVDDATVSGMAVVNTPNTIDYVGDVANGDLILATAPLNGDSTSTNGGLSIFYGPPGEVAQRPITAFGQSLSGNGSVTFSVNGASYVLAFGNVPAPDAGPFGIFTLESLTPQGGTEIAVAIRSPTPTALPAGASFTCLP